MFVIMLVNKAGELVYVHKGEMDEKAQQEFLAAAEPLR
jgi:hypothetical protein